MCDTLIATGNSTQSGFPIFAKNSDRVLNEPQYFVYVAAGDHAVGTKVRCTFIEVDQVPHTYAMILSKPSWIWGAEIGINEFGLCIGNESIFTKEVSKKSALLGMDIIRIALERAKSSREAVNVIGAMLETYGQGGNASFDAEFYYDNSFMITDPYETWYMETAGKEWAAKKIEGPYSISNFMTIGMPDALSSNAIEDAIRKGYKVTEPFDFTEAYMDWKNPSNISGCFRLGSSRRQMEELHRDATVRKMIKILRSHTTEDEWVRGDKSVCKHAGEGAQHSTTGALVVQYQQDGVLMWGCGMSTPCMAPFQPFWFDTYSERLIFPYNKQEEAMDSWLRKEQLIRAAVDGRIPVEAYRRELYEMENAWFTLVDNVPKEERQHLCDSIANEAEAFISKWLKSAGTARSNPVTTESSQAFWQLKNKNLGVDRRIAY